MARRYIAQRAVTHEFLHWDLPLLEDVPEWELSGPGSLTGSLEPDVGQLRAADGRLLLEEWGTYLYAEDDGEIRWGGIVVSSTFDGEKWRVEAAGFSTYPHGIPYVGDFAQVGIDPADALREIWRHIQSFPDGDLGVVVIGDSTPVRLGKPEAPAYTEVKLDGTWQRQDAVDPGRVIPDAEGDLAQDMTATQTTATLATGDFSQVPRPFTASIGTEKVIVNGISGASLTGLVRGAEGTAATAHYDGTTVRFVGTETHEVPVAEAEPYALSWWNSPDCGGEIDTLAKATPFDWIERHYWDGEEIRHEVEISYPRRGRRRTDLAFVQGVNVTSVVAPEVQGDDFANEILGIGAGEGRASVNRTTSERDGRLRRPHVYTDKSVTDDARMDALIREELLLRQATLQITSVEVTQHPNARIGSWQVGDDVLIDAVLPWLGRVQLWCRITAWSLTGEHTASLTLARSDSYRYGGSTA